MNLRHLEILEAVAQTGTFTAAAKRLYLTQSAVSHAVAELERQAGAVLLDRLPRGVRLTPCGALLLEEATRILAACRGLDQRIGDLEAQAPIRIASSITIAGFHLPRVLRQLQQALPALRVQVQVVSAAGAMEILLRADADLALIEGAEPQGLFRNVRLGSYGLFPVLSPDYPLAATTVTPAQLCALPLLLRERGSAIRDALDSALYLENQAAQPLWESVNSTALLQAAEAGLGVAVLPDVLLTDALAAGRLRRLEVRGMALENKMLAVTHKHKYLSKNLLQLLDALSATQHTPQPLEQGHGD